MIGDLLALVWNQFKKEPIVKGACAMSGSSALMTDLAVRGVWMPQEEALFDIHVTDTDATSYYNFLQLKYWLRLKETRKGSMGCLAKREGLCLLHFVSVDGLFGVEMEHFVNLSCHQSGKKSYRQVMGWIRAHLSFAILRATIMSLRGSRTKWRCLGIEDGAPIDWCCTVWLYFGFDICHNYFKFIMCFSMFRCFCHVSVCQCCIVGL